MSKRAGESFAASASAKQKPVMDFHAVDYKGGGDSKREELWQQDPQNIQHSGDWSSIKAPGDRK